ncbi:MAG: acyl-CoA thioester hydrolase/BAAT C-terminal domain-containing protein [Bacteroidota bacterium]
MKKVLLGLASLGILVLGYKVLDSFLFDGVQAQQINEQGFQANYFTQDAFSNRAAVVLVGGGQWGDYWASEFAKQGYAGLSLPYVGREGLPKLPEEIELEYFEKALNWLKNQEAVDADKIIIMGASRNAELSLILASTFPELVGGVIAFAPSSVSWSNTVLPYNSDELKASWTYKGNPIPFIAMEKLQAGESEMLNTLGYWSEGLKDSLAVAQASIPIEKVKGPVLLLSGKDDKVWPAAMMADMLEVRSKAYSFAYPFENIQYENTGHMISSNPDQKEGPRQGSMNIQGNSYPFEFGGSNEGDYQAKQDIRKRIMQFLQQL